MRLCLLFLRDWYTGQSTYTYLIFYLFLLEREGGLGQSNTSDWLLEYQLSYESYISWIYSTQDELWLTTALFFRTSYFWRAYSRASFFVLPLRDGASQIYSITFFLCLGLLLRATLQYTSCISQYFWGSQSYLRMYSVFFFFFLLFFQEQTEDPPLQQKEYWLAICIFDCLRGLAYYYYYSGSCCLRLSLTVQDWLILSSIVLDMASFGCFQGSLECSWGYSSSDLRSYLDCFLSLMAILLDILGTLFLFYVDCYDYYSSLSSSYWSSSSERSYSCSGYYLKCCFWVMFQRGRIGYGLDYCWSIDCDCQRIG